MIDFVTMLKHLPILVLWISVCPDMIETSLNVTYALYKKAKTDESQKQNGRTEEETAKPSFPLDSIAFSRNPRYFGTSSRNAFLSSA